MESKTKKQGSLKRSVAIVKSSWRVVKAEKKILGYEAIAGALALVLLGLFFVGQLLANNLKFSSNQMSLGQNPWYWPALAVYLVLVSGIGALIGGAISSVVVGRFNGKPLSFKQGFAAAWQKKNSLLAFGIVNATVGFLYQLLQEKLPLGGKIAAMLGDFVWSVATFFAIPAIVMSDEELNPMQAIKKSSSILKNTWKESVISNAGIGIIGVLIVMMVSGASVGLNIFVGLTAPILLWATIPAAIVAMFISGLVLAAMTDVFKSALYYFATTGTAPESFDRDLLHASFRPKKKMFR